MDKFIINGGKKLNGTISVGGAKNSAVAIIPATILANGPCVLENIPDINDVAIDLQILQEMGADVKFIDKSTIRIDAQHIKDVAVPYEMARSMRASYYFLGALLARFHNAKVSMPGGCDLGDRPIDQHIKFFNALGATSSIQHGMVSITACKLIGTPFYFDKVSVGATINAILASVKAQGQTILGSVAKEPHVVDLANFLNSIGADIRGAGTDTIKINGVKELKGTKANYAIIPDQIEAGTYMVAAAATKGDVTINGVIPKHLDPITSKLRKIGALIEENNDKNYIRVSGNEFYEHQNIKTQPHPGFPTDMQPQFAALLAMIKGSSIITEEIFENRFKYADELRRMGASISVTSKTAVIEGVERLTGARVKAIDLRAGAALIIAGLCADGVTEIEDIHHIERGYENMDEKLRSLGADITKEADSKKNVTITDVPFTDSIGAAL